jgi:hypothetical protein
MVFCLCPCSTDLGDPTPPRQARPHIVVHTNPTFVPGGKRPIFAGFFKLSRGSWHVVRIAYSVLRIPCIVWELRWV